MLYDWRMGVATATIGIDTVLCQVRIGAADGAVASWGTGSVSEKIILQLTGAAAGAGTGTSAGTGTVCEACVAMGGV